MRRRRSHCRLIFSSPVSYSSFESSLFASTRLVLPRSASCDQGLIADQSYHCASSSAQLLICKPSVSRAREPLIGIDAGSLNLSLICAQSPITQA